MSAIANLTTTQDRNSGRGETVVHISRTTEQDVDVDTDFHSVEEIKASVSFLPLAWFDLSIFVVYLAISI
jgi:hypothetical protein